MPSFIDYHRQWGHTATWLEDPILEASALMCLSAVVARRLYVRNSVKYYYPNLYMMYLTESGGGKEVAINQSAHDFVRAVNPDWIIPNPGSPEALIKTLLEKDKGCGMLFQEEFSRLITDKKYMSDMVDVLTDLYNSDKPFSKRLASWDCALEINELYFGLFVGTQPDRLMHMFKTIDITGGFIPRVATYGWKSKPFEKRVEDPLEKARVIATLKRLDTYLTGLKGAKEVDITDGALQMIFTAVDSLRKSIVDERTRSCYARAYDSLFKMALLYWVNDLTLDESGNTGNSVINEKTENSHTGLNTPESSAGLPNAGNFGNFGEPWKLGVTTRHVEQAIHMYSLTVPWTQRVADASAVDAEERGLANLSRMIQGMVERGETIQVPDGNGGTVEAIRVSMLLRKSHMQARTLQAYMATIVQHETIVGPSFSIKDPHAQRPTWYYPIIRRDRDENPPPSV